MWGSVVAAGAQTLLYIHIITYLRYLSVDLKGEPDKLVGTYLPRYAPKSKFGLY